MRIGLALISPWPVPTAHDYLAANYPATVAWIGRMHSPVDEGGREAVDSLKPTLLPLLRNRVAARFLPWSEANAKAWAAGEAETALEFDGRRYRQKTFKHHAYSRDQLLDKYSRVSDNASLGALLEEAGCLQYISPLPTNT